jgi:Collagen triple helix repeat (20 copies)
MNDETQNNSSPDPAKHVNYTKGMVLGVDDFVQEFAYLSGRDSLLAREVIGYGTVCGLQVIAQTDALGSRIRIKPGAAITPKGQFVQVIEEQCAQLNDWLALPEIREKIKTLLGANLEGHVSLNVKLCYRECLTNNVPIPGEPCRNEKDALAPSRIKDDFKLELSFDLPEQREEQALRNFVSWLAQIPIKEDDGATTLEQFLKAVREANFSVGPVGLGWIHPTDICDFLQAAFRVWVTELRPTWLGTDQTCAGNPPVEDCVLLASLFVPVLQDAGVWKVKAPTAEPKTQVEVLEDDRPFVLSLRMLQEWMLCGRSYQAGAAGMVGPKGANGEKGEKGDKGDTGNKGDQGDKGDQGAKGDQGIQGETGAPGISDDAIIAAGRFDVEGNSVGKDLFSFGKLEAVFIPNNNAQIYLITFAEFNPEQNYVVKGTPVSTLGVLPSVFEILEVERGLAAFFKASVDGNLRLSELVGANPTPSSIKKVGIPVRISGVNNEPTKVGFMIEVSLFKAV